MALDADERIVLNGEDLRKTMFETVAGVLLMPDRNHAHLAEQACHAAKAARLAFIDASER